MDVNENYFQENYIGFKILIEDSCFNKESEKVNQILLFIYKNIDKFLESDNINHEYDEIIRQATIYIDLDNWEKVKDIGYPREFVKPGLNNMGIHYNKKYFPDELGSQKLEHIVIGSMEKTLNTFRHFPDALIHEFGHVLHFRKYSFEDERILQCYNHAKENIIYDKNSYPLRDGREYFACLSTAYIGESDVQPRNIEELRELDSKGFELMKDYWN